MSKTRVTLAQTMKKWDTLNAALKPLLTEIPAAAKDQADFEASIGRVRALAMSQDSLTGQVRDTIKSRQTEQVAARALYNRLASHLRAKFGPNSDLLLEFAVKPRRQVRRKKQATPATTTPQPETPAPEVKPKA